MNRGFFFILLCCSFHISTFQQSFHGFRQVVATSDPDPGRVKISIKTISEYFLSGLSLKKALIRLFYFGLTTVHFEP